MPQNTFGYSLLEKSAKIARTLLSCYFLSLRMPAINPGIYHRIKFTPEYEISCFRDSQFAKSAQFALK
jgi:hypothetical protein